MEWRIWTESTRIHVDEDAWSKRADMLLEELELVPGVLGPAGWGQIDHLGAVFIVETDRLADAVGIGAEAFARALEHAAGDLDAQPLRIEVTPADWEPVQLVGATDVGRILGVSRQRVYQLTKQYPDFPSSTGEVAGGAVWDRRDIEAWSEKDRPVGRPMKPPRDRVERSTVSGRIATGEVEPGTRRATT